jgi:uncharacterized protein YjiS (DUF1127 family)
MFTQSTPTNRFRTSISFLSLTFGAFRVWNQKRRDQRILDSLGPEQLKDIGYRRSPNRDEYERI